MTLFDVAKAIDPDELRASVMEAVTRLSHWRHKWEPLIVGIGVMQVTCGDKCKVCNKIIYYPGITDKMVNGAIKRHPK